MKWLFSFISALVVLLSGVLSASAADIVFVTQAPFPNDFATINSTLGNHRTDPLSTPRGGDLYIRYSDGTLKNLTQAAGYGNSGRQGAGSIAVRDPAVSWDGTRDLFSMVIGAPTSQYQVIENFWQIYEMSGLGINQTPVITKVANQPTNYNNVMPIYSADDKIIFVTDRPRDGQAHLYPQRDEYESTSSNTGIWKLTPATGALELLDHSPSGDFNPQIDSFGRIIFTRWDHMQRDQQAGGLTSYGAFNYSSEVLGAPAVNSQVEVYPEARSVAEQTDATVNLHQFNQFFPWQLNQDGTDLETLNHIGRHELHDYFEQSINNDPQIKEFIGPNNSNRFGNFMQIREDPTVPGRYFGINAPEFATHAAGQIVALVGPPGVPASDMPLTEVTHPSTSSTTPGPNHSGLYRDPLPLADGSLVVSHTDAQTADANLGTRAVPVSRYSFRLSTITASNGYQVSNGLLTAGIRKDISYWDPDVLATYTNALMWELQPVEVRARTRPTANSSHLESPEQQIFTQKGVSVQAFTDFLKTNSLALIITRNMTSRDVADKQQPYNLRVPGSATQTIANNGKVYDVSHLQIFQGDLLRAYSALYGGNGRRVLAQPLHDQSAANIANPTGPAGSVKIAADGSTAAFVPAGRALTWQATDSAGTPVIRERYWLTFKSRRNSSMRILSRSQ